MERFEIKDLTFTYPLCARPVLREVGFSVEKGEFVLLCGATGSGKSTLLRLLKPEIAPLGSKSGEISFFGRALSDVPPEKIGFVTQRPDEQIVTDRVYSELAFGLENLGLPQSVIARRVAEMASYFGIEDWFERDVSTLSGGQKQLLNLASVMVMNPELIILDEPTSQLDPIATSDFLGTLKKLNRDFSLTVIIVEHRLEELVSMCDRLLVLRDGALVRNGPPREVVAGLDREDPLIGSMPTAARLYHALSENGSCPLTVGEGRRFVESNYNNAVSALDRGEYNHSEKKALEFKDVFFRYKRELPDVLKGLNLTVFENEIFCILGGNGSGKTTALSCASGIRRIYSGEIRVLGKKLKQYIGGELYKNCLTLLPQEVQSVFLRNTVREELSDAGIDHGELPFDLSGLLDSHPYDLSGGEQQLLALAKVLGTKPRLLLMDEPTKGLDAERKMMLTEILRRLKADGVTVVIVTHDVEFAATTADRCALFFRGDIVSVGRPGEFFSENSFYTTAASRMTKGFFQNAVTVEDVCELCRANGRRDGDA
ncbi:MAG: ATP-binding cassette domain-containing protein [Clostridia bacterium]|nr:ATP-binding cassette domain-containing protein [Clostridia bacterium]